MRRDSRDYMRWKRKKKNKRWLLKGSFVLGGVLTGFMAVYIGYAGKVTITNDGFLVFGQNGIQNSTDYNEDEENEDTNENQQEESRDEQQNQEEVEKEDKEEPIIENEPEPEMEYVGVSDAGKEYAYDASVVAEKLQSYDYYHDEEKVVFLTFDDGTSNTVTPKVLDILAEYDVKATFFLVGKAIADGGENAKKLVRREFEEGHAIANHTYSHDYSKLYPKRSLDLDYFVKDLKKTNDLIQEILGVNFRTRVFRCPGGSMSWNNMTSLKAFQEEEDFVSIDWNALTKDAEGKKKNASELFDCMIETSKDKDMVVLLMHDTFGKEETVKVLPRIIEHYKERGYEFRTLV